MIQFNDIQEGRFYCHSDTAHGETFFATHADDSYVFGVWEHGGEETYNEADFPMEWKEAPCTVKGD